MSCKATKSDQQFTFTRQLGSSLQWYEHVSYIHTFFSPYNLHLQITDSCYLTHTVLKHYNTHQNKKNRSDKREKNAKIIETIGRMAISVSKTKQWDLSKINDCFFGSKVLVYQIIVS